MPQFKTVQALGTIGLVGKADNRPYETPDPAWNRIDNGRFHNGSAMAYGAAVCVTKFPTIAHPDREYITEFTYHISGPDKYWLTFGSESCYALEAATSSCGDPARQKQIHEEHVPYGDNVWVVDKIYGNTIATNQQSPPLYLAYNADISGSQDKDSLQKLPGWDAEFSTDEESDDSSCEVLISHRGFMLAGNIVDHGEHHPTRIVWSDILEDVEASGGRIPDDWESANPANLAGSFWLPTNTGHILAAARLRNDVIFYTETSIYRVSNVGGRKIYDYMEIYSNQGIYGPKCVVEFDGKHFLITQDDIVIFDGQNITTIADGRVRRTIFNSLTNDNRKKVSVSADHGRSEIWVTFPADKDVEGVNRAFVWSWEDNVWSERSLETSETYYEGCYTTIVRENLTLESDFVVSDESARRWDEFPDDDTWNNLPEDVTWGSSVASTGDKDMYCINYTPGNEVVDFNSMVRSLSPTRYHLCDDSPLDYDVSLVDDRSGNTARRLKAVDAPGMALMTPDQPPIMGSGNNSVLVPDDIGGLTPIYWQMYPNGNCINTLLRSTDEIGGPVLYFEGVYNDLTVYVAPLTGDLRYEFFRHADGSVTQGSAPIFTGAFPGAGSSRMITMNIHSGRSRIKFYVNGAPALDVDFREPGTDPQDIIRDLKYFLYGRLSGQPSGASFDISNAAYWDNTNISPQNIERMYNSLGNVEIHEANRISKMDQRFFRVHPETGYHRSDSVCVFERANIDLTGGANVAVILGVYPRSDSVNPFNVYVGFHDSLGSAIQWSGPYEFDPRTDHKISCRVRGRMHALRYEAIGHPFRVFGHEIEYEVSGERGYGL